MKTCKKCSNELPITAFYVHKEMADGHLSFCKRCVRSRVRNHRGANLDRIRSYDRRRGHRVYDETHERARAEVYNALRRGELVKENCWCGEIAEAHHEDYSKPLEVTWLCKKHHMERHIQLREVA